MAQSQSVTIISLAGTIGIAIWAAFSIFLVSFFIAIRHSAVWSSFAIIAYWSPVVATLFSFVKPRLAAYWLLLGAAFSLTIATAYGVNSLIYAARHPSNHNILPSIVGLLLVDPLCLAAAPTLLAVCLLNATGKA